MTDKELDKVVLNTMKAAKELCLYSEVREHLTVAIEAQKYWMKEANRD